MNPTSRSELAEAVSALRPYFRRATLFALIAGVMALAPSGYMLEVYERVVNSRNHLTLFWLTVMVLWAFLIMGMLEWARGQILYGANAALDRTMGDRVFEASFGANLRGLPSGSPQSMTDLRTVREFLYSTPMASLMETPVSLVFLALIYAIHPLLGWLTFAGIAVQVVIALLNERSTQPRLVEANRVNFAAQKYADGTLRNAQVIEAMGMQRDIYSRWIQRQREFLQLQADASERGGLFQALTRLVQLVLSSAVLGLAAWLILRDELGVNGGGLMIVASILGARAVAPLSTVITQWRVVVNARDAWERLTKLLENVPARPPAMKLPAPRGALLVEGIVAMPPGSNVPVLRGVQFGLKPGEVLGVVGPSAAGKTTLGRVLMGLWPSAGGKVRLDGADVFAWDKTELGPYVGYLPQDVELFEGTIAENIARFGEPEKAKVEAAARAVGLHDYIASLPEGYETEVGGDGARLSGGQRQRVGLARAIYGNPVFVVLDEPNSGLDEAGDAALAAAITELKALGTTFVVITHRTSVLSVADKLLVLRDGQMQAFGPKDEVLAALAKAAAQVQQQAAQRRAGGQPQLAGTA